jgi:anaerobic magnesium-protoporphyrin IX monomethyl ester cyclase
MSRVLLMCMPDIYQPWHAFHIKGPWIGGASIAANCPNHEVYVADLLLKRSNIQKGIKEAIDLADPQVIGLSAMTFQYPTAVKIAGHIKKTYPGVPIALGGYHATAERIDIAESMEGQVFDYIFAGEAEHTFRQFLDGRNTDEISGLSYKKDGKWRHNQRVPALCRSGELDSIKPPKRESRIWGGYHFHSRKVDTAESSRGCDYACKFCSMRVMMPKAKYKAFNIERVIRDLKSAKKMGAESIFFTDDNPAMHAEHFKLLNEWLISERLDDMHYSGMVSPESMAEPGVTELMKRAGWEFSFLGVENIYQGILDRVRKRSNADLAARAVDNLYKNGITTLAGLIVGNSDDTEEIIRMNFEWLRNHPVDSVMPQYLTPYPGTIIRKELLKEGLVINNGGMENDYGGWSTYNGEFAHCRTRSGLTPAELETIVYEEYRAFCKHRFNNLIKGRLVFPKNNPRHALKWVLREPVPKLMRACKMIGLSVSEKAKQERQRKMKMNQFNI